MSIRAYGAQSMFRKGLYQRIDRFTRVNRELWNLNRWIAIQTDVLAGIFCASLAAYLIYGGRMDSSRTGFSINMAGRHFMVRPETIIHYSNYRLLSWF